MNDFCVVLHLPNQIEKAELFWHWTYLWVCEIVFTKSAFQKGKCKGLSRIKSGKIGALK